MSWMLGSKAVGASAVMSQQSITVSVPAKGQKGVVVALVQPGKPSQLLTDPTVQKACAATHIEQRRVGMTKPVVWRRPPQTHRRSLPATGLQASRRDQKTAEVDKGSFF